MTAGIDAETLMAYADGELDPIATRRVERALADDPEAAAEVERHRALRRTLAGAFDPVAAEPVPEALRRMLAAPTVVDFAAARKAREKPRPAPRLRWAIGGAIAATLTLGVLVGQQFGGGAPVAGGGSTPIASNGLQHALNTQLASTQGDGVSTRVLLTFRDKSGAICRTFSSAQLAGIACRDRDAWLLRTTHRQDAGSSHEYRQAASLDAALMAEAEGMMAGDPFDAAAEAQARRDDWKEPK
jgi:hypothetical protein